MNDQERKDAALATLAIIAQVWRDNSNALLAHGITTDAANPEAAVIRLIHTVTQLAK